MENHIARQNARKRKKEKKEAVKGGEENRNYPYGKEQALRIGIIDADLLYRKKTPVS